MTYVSPNFRSLKQLKDAIKQGRPVYVYAPGLGSVPNDGPVYLEGPHYPEPHSWYATGTMKGGRLIKVR